MEPFLRELRKDVLQKYTNKNVIIYPVHEDRTDVAFFEVKKKKCRTFYYNFIQDTGYVYCNEYTFSNTRLEQYHSSVANQFEVICVNDNNMSYILKAMLFDRFDEIRGYYYNAIFVFRDIIKNVPKYNIKLIRNLCDCGLLNTPNLLQCIPEKQYDSIKKTFEMSIKYLKTVGISRITYIKKCIAMHLSPDETKWLYDYGWYWPVCNDEVTFRQCKYIIKNDLRPYYYSDYLRLRKYLTERNIDISSFPECPLNSTIEHIIKLHDDICRIANRVKQLEREQELIQKNQEYLENYYPKATEFEYKNNVYSIIACSKLSDLIYEGSELHHCVGSYIDSVHAGREYILFLRKNEQIDVPFFTIDILPDKKVRQIHGLCNCDITDEIKPFLRKWAEKFELNISSINGLRCCVG